jgi:hypothetical protein
VEEGENSMKRLRGPTGLCLALVALLALAAGEARAGSLELIIVTNGHTITIAGGPFGTYSPDGNTLTVTNITGLNTTLASDGSAVQFNTLGASSNFAPSAGNAAGSTVAETGSAFFLSGSSGVGTLTVQAIQTGFQLPSGMTGAMQSNATANFAAAPANSSQTFTSSYNALMGPGLTSTSTGLPQNNYSPSATTPIPTFVTPFSISSLTSFSLLNNPSTSATDQFTGSTTISANAVPEPSSFSLVLAGGIPFAVYHWLRRRRMATS